jgi:hypothetical protein
MDIEQFVKNHQPRMRTSRLDKYLKEITALKEQKFTDEQIRQWLATNEIQITREAVRQFVKKISKAVQVKATPQITDKIESTPTETATIVPNVESQAEKLRRKLAEQQADAEKTRFKHDKSGNTN